MSRLQSALQTEAIDQVSIENEALEKFCAKGKKHKSCKPHRHVNPRSRYSECKNGGVVAELKIAFRHWSEYENGDGIRKW